MRSSSAATTSVGQVTRASWVVVNPKSSAAARAIFAWTTGKWSTPSGDTSPYAATSGGGIGTSAAGRKIMPVESKAPLISTRRLRGPGRRTALHRATIAPALNPTSGTAWPTIRESAVQDDHGLTGTVLA